MAQLKEIINEMNQTFLDYNSKAINSGVITWNSAIGHDLKEATQRFLHLAKKADLEIGSDDREQSATSEQPLDYESQFNQPMTPVHDPHFSTIEQASMVPSGPVGMLGYEVTYEPEPFPETHGTDENIIDSENVNDRDLTNDPENMNNVRNIGSQDYYQGFGQDPQWDVNLYQNRAEIPSPSSLARNFQPNPANDNLLTPTYTYSFQETTFARRLLRSSYETAFRLLNDPCTPRSEIHRRLRFTFCHANVDTIIARLRSILSRSNKDNLENWDFPILHAGDAGFHYPRGPLDNGAPLPQKWGERRSIGPWKQGQALNREAEAAGPESFACMAKCEGTWFDPNDVEEYYKTKGLFLDGISSVAELEVDVPMSSTLSREMTAMGSPTSTSTESVTEPRSSPESLVYDTGNAFHTKTNAFVDTNNDDDISNLFTSVRSEHGAFDFSCEAFKEIEKTAEYLPLQQPQYYSSYTPTVGKRRIIIDVDRLLESKCLYILLPLSIPSSLPSLLSSFPIKGKVNYVRAFPLTLRKQLSTDIASALAVPLATAKRTLILHSLQL